MLFLVRSSFSASLNPLEDLRICEGNCLHKPGKNITRTIKISHTLEALTSSSSPVASATIKHAPSPTARPSGPSPTNAPLTIRFEHSVDRCHALPSIFTSPWLWIYLNSDMSCCHL